VAAVVVGTRGSALARRQTASVIELLRAAWPELGFEERAIVTEGDRTQQTGEPLPEIGGKGLFTAALEQGLRDGELDLAVHSLKDLPTEEAPGITVGAVCVREDARDCLVSRDGLMLADLPAGAVVGTSSLRRSAQLRAHRPDLAVRSIRGNVDTRIRKVRDGEFDATLLAVAGIQRLGLEHEVTEWLTPETMLPAPGQGALAVQCRADDERVLELLAPIDDPKTRAETTAERAFLSALGSGCTAPVAAYATAADGMSEPSNTVLQGHVLVRLRGLVASPDGLRVVRVSGDGAPDEIGERLAREALASGADEILRAARGPLRGRRIVVTRPREHAAVLVKRLELLGAEASVVPLISIEPLGDDAAFAALVERGDHDWIVFTSANAVRAVGSHLRHHPARMAAVGPATAQALRQVGVEPAFVPKRFAAGEIAGGLEPLADARVLLPQSEIAEPLLADELRARGASVDVVDAYRTVAREPAEQELAVLSAAEAILVASGSAARSLASALTPSEGTLVVCIGPKTAEAAREVGLEVGLVARESTADGMIDALTSHFGERP
jgi:hydroxymethylbilane synthase